MRRDYVATTLSVGYDDLQPIARGIRSRIEPFFVLDASRQPLVWGLDSLKNLVVATVDLRMALDDVAPALVGQLHTPTIGIANRATNGHAGSPTICSASEPNAADNRRAASALGR